MWMRTHSFSYQPWDSAMAMASLHAAVTDSSFSRHSVSILSGLLKASDCSMWAQR